MEFSPNIESKNSVNWTFNVLLHMASLFFNHSFYILLSTFHVLSFVLCLFRFARFNVSTSSCVKEWLSTEYLKFS